MLFQMCGVFAEFERAMISERVRAGLKRVRANGPARARRLSDGLLMLIQSLQRTAQFELKLVHCVGPG
jgi:Resolvase, N terminal domain